MLEEIQTFRDWRQPHAKWRGYWQNVLCIGIAKSWKATLTCGTRVPWILLLTVHSLHLTSPFQTQKERLYTWMWR